MAGGVFPCKVTAPGRNTKCRSAFRLCLHTCLILPHSRSALLARKTAIPAEEAQSSFTRGKVIRTQTFQNFLTMRVKRMTIKEGKRHGISRFPNFHRSGSVRGMKRLYYGNDCLLVRCGNFIYNVTAEPQIYNQATI